MNVLLITQKGLNGLNYHRQIVPHNHLQRVYREYKIDMVYNLNEVSDEQLKNYQIVSFLRIIDGSPKETIERAKKFGAKVIIDIDDYWKLHSKHPLLTKYKELNYESRCLEGLINADWVTTTTEHFADKIKEVNPNVVVLPNAIDSIEHQFMPMSKQSDRARIGWIGGVFHVPDIAMLYEGFKDVWKSCNKSKFQLCLGGWNYDHKYPQQQQQYDIIENIFTDFYKYIEPSYKEYLLKRIPNDNHNWIDHPYKRMLAQPANKYAEMYNELDVCLVPLEENNFNSFKSQIKIIEAGYFKKAVIVSNVMPYTIDCNRNNATLISPSKRGEGWGVAMKSHILNPNKGKDQAEALHELVMSKYTMDVVNKTRHEFYQTLK